jgi:hypothetical protein|eukprot:31349-Pelagococcus_subviridis.AAC.18
MISFFFHDGSVGEGAGGGGIVLAAARARLSVVDPPTHFSRVHLAASSFVAAAGARPRCDRSRNDAT